MGKLGYLFIAYAFIWTGIFVFLLSIARKLTNVERQLELFQELRRDRSGASQ